MKRWIFLLLTMIFLLSQYTPLEAKSKGKKKGGNNKTVVSSEMDNDYSAEEITIIREYLGQDVSSGGKKGGKGKKQKSLPPGLQKKIDRGWDLPPGWQKKVQKGEVLPTDLYKQAEKVPDDVLQELPEQNKDIETIILESKVVKVLKKTMEIVDILDL